MGRPDGPVAVPLLVVHPGGARDTLAFRPDPTGVRVAGVGTFDGIRPDPLAPLHDVVPGGGGVVLAEWGRTRTEGGGLVVRRHAPDGRVERTDTVRFVPVPVDPDAADSIVAAASDSIRARLDRAREAAREAGFEGPPEAPDEIAGLVREGLALGTSFAPIRGLVAGLDGTVWVRAVTGPATASWVALDRDGRALFAVDLPAGAALHAASRRAIWTTETDAFEVPYVVRYDLVDGTPGEG